MENEEFIDQNIVDRQYILSKHKILVDYTLKSLQTPEGIHAYARRALKRVLHDDAEISKVKLKKPSVISRAISKMGGKTPQARLYVTTKF
jgi:hypothetical protein